MLHIRQPRVEPDLPRPTQLLNNNNNNNNSYYYYNNNSNYDNSFARKPWTSSAQSSLDPANTATGVTMSSDAQHMFPVMAPDHPFHQYPDAWSQQPQQPQQQPPISTRQYPSTSSAFSDSAHPDEDWTKVSDLAERRRIQNRIAQRNYRKKIKERISELERRAGADGSKNHSSSSSSSSKKTQKTKKSPRRQPSPPTSRSAQSLAPPRHASHNPFTPPMNPEDHFFSSPSPPPTSSPVPSAYHSTYSPPSDNGLVMAPFGSPQAHAMSTTAPYQFGMVTTTAPPTLPPMNFFADAYKAPNINGGNESMSSFPSYGDYQLGVNPSHYDSNPHTPSLSPCLDQCENISEAEWSAYPVTPLSMGSP